MLFKVDQQQGNSRCCHSRYAPGARQCGGPPLTQFLFHLVGKAVNCRVIQVKRQRGVFMTPQTINVLLLPVDIAGVLGLDRHLLSGLQVAAGLSLQPGYIGILELGALQQVSQRILPGNRVFQLACQCLGLGCARVNPGGREAMAFTGDGFTLGFKALPAGIIHQAQGPPALGKAQVGIVLAQQQAVFRPGREHAIGLQRAHGNEVIDQHSNISLIPTRTPGLLALHRQRCI